MSSKILVIGSLPKSLINFRGKLLEEIVNAGHTVHVAANNLDSDAISCKTLKQIGVQTHSITLQRNGLNPINDLLSILAIIRLYLFIRPNIVLSYTIKPVVWGGLSAALFPNIKFFALITGLGYAFTGQATGKRLLVKKIIQWLYKLSLKKASSVIFQNPDDRFEFLESRIISQKKETFIVNGSGVDLKHFYLSEVPKGITTFLMISRLIGDKGIREYLEAGKIINQNGSIAKFNLLGDIDSNPDAVSEKEIANFNNLDWFSWIRSDSDVRAHLKKCHVYVLPSYREGTPRTVLEAMSMGRPIITTNAAGCRETVLEGENGFLIPIKDPKSLANAMHKFIRNPKLILDMGIKSRLFAEEKYDVNKVNREMMIALDLVE